MMKFRRRQGTDLQKLKKKIVSGRFLLVEAEAIGVEAVALFVTMPKQCK